MVLNFSFFYRKISEDKLHLEMFSQYNSYSFPILRQIKCHFLGFNKK